MTKKSAAGPGELRKFGLLFAAVGAILAGVFWWKGSDVWWIPAACAVVFAGAGIIAPTILRPLHTPWMAFAKFLGWLNTRILLTLFFYLVITPVGLLFRLFGKDSMEKRGSTDAATYWQSRGDVVNDKSRYENLF